MLSSPRLSIGLPVYNGERYLEEAVGSLLGQTFGDFELVICDNASTDRTGEIAAAIVARDARVRYVRNDSNIGASPNFARVATLTTAPLFKWAAHDDLYEPTYLEACVRLLDARPEVVLAHSDTVFIDEGGSNFPAGSGSGRFVDPRTGIELAVDRVDLAETGPPLARFADVVFNSRIGSHMFGVVRRSALQRTGSIQNIPSSDRPFLAELALLGPFAQVRAPLFRKRFHAAMTWALTSTELKTYVSGNSPRYSRRARQLKVYLTAPCDKPVTLATKIGCLGVVLAYSVNAAARNLLRRRASRRQADAWRGKPAPEKPDSDRQVAN